MENEKILNLSGCQTVGIAVQRYTDNVVKIEAYDYDIKVTLYLDENEFVKFKQIVNNIGI